MTTVQAASYHDTRTRFADDRLDVIARLVEAGLHDDYVVYENDAEWCFAGGVLVEITLDRHGARLLNPADPSGCVALPWCDDPMTQVRQLLERVEVPGWRAYGWAAFELAYAKRGNLSAVGDQPLLRLIVPRTEVRLTPGHAQIRSTNPDTLDVVRGLVEGISVLQPGQRCAVDVRADGSDRYQQAVARAVHEINDHRLDKVILSRIVPLEEPIDLLQTYVAGRRANTPARSFLLRLSDLEAAGFSPEIVLKVDPDGRVVSQPLAGTRALSADQDRNAALRRDLVSDPKEIYEHAISVKTAWDELESVCEPGTLAVEEFMSVCRRGTVQHLASRVAGRLSPGSDAWEAFGAVFPAVTASGVPKDAAYVSIRSNEPCPRGLYSGAVITVDQGGGMDAALVLRAVYRQGGRTWLQAGAGIVGQSRPDREFEETSEKLDSVARHLVTTRPLAALHPSSRSGPGRAGRTR